jgi:hypothetical protein
MGYTMDEQIFIRLRGRIQGPFTSDQLQSLAMRGQFSRAHEVSNDGVSWARASNRPDLFPAVLERVSTVQQSTDPVSPQEHQPSTESPGVIPPPIDVWYFSQHGTNHGPVDFAHLQRLASSGQIVAEDMVWQEGFSEWVAAGRVPGLMKAAVGSPSLQPSDVYYRAMAPSNSRARVVPRVSSLAVASLVLGILWLAGIGSILAIVFGAVSIYQIHHSRGKLAGMGMAVAGLVLGIVMITLQLILVLTNDLTPEQFGF